MISARFTWLAVVVTAVCIGSPAAAADKWKEQREDCDHTAFYKPDETPLKKIGRCARLWEAYKDVTGVSGAYKKRVVAALSRLYAEGSERDAKVATFALKRLGVNQLPERKVAAAAESKREVPSRSEPAAKESKRSARREEAAPTHEKCSPPKPSKSDIRAAKRHFKRGFAAYRKKDYEGTLKHYLQMHAAAPGWPKSLYNLAAAYALLDDADNSVKMLQCMADLGDEESISYLKKARVDEDFVPIRNKSAAFKRLTGYAKIKIGNSLGEYGEDNVDNLVDGLEKLQFTDVVVREGKRRWRHPHIWFKADSWGTASLIQKFMGHPETTMSVIDWDDEEYDIAIAWGDRIKKGEEPTTYVPEPADADDAIDDISRKENQMLSEPDAYAMKAQKVAESPGKAVDHIDKLEGKIDKTMNAPQNVMDKASKTGEKVEGLFNKFK